MPRRLKAQRIEEYKRKMATQVRLSQDDAESAHGKADDLLCELLTELGYKEVVDRFELVHKWYA